MNLNSLCELFFFDFDSIFEYFCCLLGISLIFNFFHIILAVKTLDPLNS